MKRFFKTFIIFLLFLSVTNLYAQFRTGDRFFEGWEASKRLDQNIGKGIDAQDEMFFLGYILGVVDSTGNRLDIPPDVTVRQLGKIVGKYLDDHPESSHELGSVLVCDALLEVFPFKK